MIRYLLILLLAGCAFPCLGQSLSGDSLFIVTYVTGPLWDGTKKPNEQVYFKEHSANLSRLRKDGTIKMGGRYADKGIIVISATSFNKAIETITMDEAVIHKLFIVDIQRLNVFYEGCIEKPK